MYIDAHTHLDFFNEKIDDAIYEINNFRILTIANGMDVESYLQNKEYSKRSEYIKATFGIHPWKAAEYIGELKDLIPYIEESEIIGEIGLDFFWVEDKESYESQRKIFNFILDESIKRNKVISIHTKGAEEEIYNILNNYGYNKVIIHWYSGDIKILDKFIELGCYFTVSVDLGYSELSEEILSRIPINRLLVETDGPTALEWVNGEYGYPSAIIDVVKKIAERKALSIDALSKIIQDNFFELTEIKL
ncbi:TatD family hydrolase [Clostridium saccharobutylicum]|uniref:Hydrolase of PHP superfamily n=1 Tax=Clostridium saccharobutylicum DSM 13864 TaxID=1345695 RepID=U5MS72_CLOSA|nr:TatD family hydrolase [Clostridium saccharobutylicum]AGX43430.1 hydrolase of PHP superfamily [Clostridium saccharobutylicum DSM 13864]AQR90729.1 putative deoxyribonuclease YcfH [Clostridium saccharobutylicum]AQS00633.1 putative deoxyribonuclease YcfH [Clostridium saccharobutylicum]AQS14616.1 putative deoxyribonuclease YcfH [Clostridium saccharobutylicum]MBA2907231.1 TatD DNase family protein [Clostridium saccharobutylicum]